MLRVDTQNIQAHSICQRIAQSICPNLPPKHTLLHTGHLPSGNPQKYWGAHHAANGGLHPALAQLINDLPPNFCGTPVHYGTVIENG